MQKKYFTLIFDLNNGNSYDNYNCYYANYKFLNKIVYILRVSSDIFETNNCLKKWVYLCKLKTVVKTRKSGFYYFYLIFRDV